MMLLSERFCWEKVIRAGPRFIATMQCEEGEWKYAVYGYDTNNIGDDIQSVASMRFLPKVDFVIDREKIHRFQGPRSKAILNAFYIDSAKHFPPSGQIDPLLTSIHVTPSRRDAFLKTSKDYLVEHGPVGCRDLTTLEWLEDNGVPAYFSGCLTLTLQPNPGIKRKNHVLAVDVDEKTVEALRKNTDAPIYTLSHFLDGPFRRRYGMRDRLRFAKILLSMYNSAKCVISRRLHVAYPSLAMGTPTLLLDADTETYPGRFDGMLDFVNHMSSEELLAGAYDLDSPPGNPTRHLRYREELVKTCSGFTGYDSPVSPVPVSHLHDLIPMVTGDTADTREIYISEMIKRAVGKVVDRFVLGKREPDYE